MAASHRFTAKRKAAFLTVLGVFGNVSAAARLIGVTSSGAYKTRAYDRAFAEAWDEAVSKALSDAYMEARRRAVDGVDVPVLHRGRQVGTRKRYSDTLMIVLLEIAWAERAANGGGRDKPGHDACGRAPPSPRRQAQPDVDPEAVALGGAVADREADAARVEPRLQFRVEVGEAFGREREGDAPGLAGR